MCDVIAKSAAVADKHLGDITAIVSFQEHVFTSGGDGKVKVWSEDLTLKKEISVHESWIYSMAADSKGRIYTSSRDGTIRSLPNPVHSDEVKELLKCGDKIETLFVDSEDNLYSGDDKGIVTMWVNHKIKFKFNLVEEVRSLAIQNNYIYSSRENFLTITEVMEGSATGRYMTKASIPGRFPVALCGNCTNGVYNNVAIVSCDGHGIVFVKNNAKEHFAVSWTKEKAHNQIISCLLGANDYLYTAGDDGFLKQWSIADKDPKLLAEVNLCCDFLKALCLGADNLTVYAGGSDGILKLVKFS